MYAFIPVEYKQKIPVRKTYVFVFFFIPREVTSIVTWFFSTTFFFKFKFKKKRSTAFKFVVDLEFP